jgi:cyclophilin family peptidyl-prolyl cis-trans isomerase
MSKRSTGIISTNLGDIHLSFFPNLAPATVRNFKRLSDSGFYDGLLFHRIIPDFLIQAGDPLSRNCLYRNKWGFGGPYWNVIAEFNRYGNKRGTISMARLHNPNSAGSQFFIAIKDLNFLNGSYTVFGKVTTGMEIVDQISCLKTDAADAPIEIEKARILKVAIRS